LIKGYQGNEFIDNRCAIAKYSDQFGAFLTNHAFTEDWLPEAKN